MNGAVGGNALQTQLIALAVVLIVVVRFLVRELRARTVRVSTMWLRPAFLGALTVFFAASAVRQSPESEAELALSLTVGVAFGAVVGFLVAASTTVERAGAPGVLRLRGSWVTVAIWVAALLVRLGVRLLKTGGSLLATTSLALSAGTICMVAVAFATFSVLVVMRSRSLPA